MLLPVVFTTAVLIVTWQTIPIHYSEFVPEPVFNKLPFKGVTYQLIVSVIDVVLVSLLLTLNRFHTLFWCCHC